MIIGGVNAAAACRPAATRTNYCEHFLPCSANIAVTGISAAIEQTTPTPLVYSVTARVRNVADTVWLTLGSASYCQVTRDETGNLDTADLTLQQPETWSAYRTGGTYENVLRPSMRRLQIRAGLVVNGVAKMVPLFEGHVTNYSESLGANGGAISLRLEDLRDVMMRSAPPTFGNAQLTAYAMARRNVEYYRDGSGDHTVIMMAGDRIETTGFVVGTSLDGLLRGIIGGPLMQISGAGDVEVGVDDDSRTDSGVSFTYSDASVLIASREGGSGQFNTVRCYGLSGGTATTSTVTDAADVALRGTILYAAGLVGSPSIQLTDAEAIAAGMISATLRGTFALELPFNPYLKPGMVIGFSSTRLSVPASTGRVRRINHQFSVSRSRTYVRDFNPVPT